MDCVLRVRLAEPDTSGTIRACGNEGCHTRVATTNVASRYWVVGILQACSLRECHYSSALEDGDELAARVCQIR